MTSTKKQKAKTTHPLLNEAIAQKKATLERVRDEIAKLQSKASKLESELNSPVRTPVETVVDFLLDMTEFVNLASEIGDYIENGHDIEYQFKVGIPIVTEHSSETGEILSARYMQITAMSWSDITVDIEETFDADYDYRAKLTKSLIESAAGRELKKKYAAINKQFKNIVKHACMYVDIDYTEQLLKDVIYELDENRNYFGTQ